MASKSETDRRWRWLWRGILALLVTANAAIILTQAGAVQRGTPVDEVCASCTVWAIAERYPKLRAEIDQALAEEGLQHDHLDCGGHRLGKRWGAIQHTEVAPFYCGLGPVPRKRSFIVDAANIYLNDRDEPFDPYSGSRYTEARKVEIGKPRWKWGQDEWRP